MGLLEKPLIYSSPRFCKSCPKCENPCLWIIKKISHTGGKESLDWKNRPILWKFSAFFVNVSSEFSSSWNSFHRYHPASWIFVIIHVEKTFRAMTGEMCGKYIKKKTENHKTHFSNTMNVFWFPGKDIDIYIIFNKIKKFISLAFFPVVPLTR